MKSLQTQHFYEFSGFRLEPNKRRLFYGDELVPLTPKEFDVLFFLIQNTQRTVEKEEILANVWKDTFVEEGTLTRNISWLRKKLAAHGGETKIIETLPKRGYRFLPEIFVDKNAFLIEEQTIEHIEIEEIIEIEPFANEVSTIQNQSLEVLPNKIKALPAAPAKRSFSVLLILLFLLIAAVGTLIAYRDMLFQKQSKVILTTATYPFSGLPGRENMPAFSPDGKQMVFSWDGGIEGGNLDVYVKLIGSGEPMRVTNGETDEIKPIFSPDGKSIAFVRIFPTHNEIVLIPALGGAERKIYEKASYASISFSPDGKFLAYADLNASDGDNPGISTINIQTGEKSKLTNPAATVVDHTPRFSPDGKSLAFVRYFSSFHREIFIVPVSGGEPRQITSDATRIYGLAWNIDSRSLFFTSYRAVNQLNLWKIWTDKIGEPQMIATGSNKLSDLSVSPDGKTIAFVEEIVDENIWEFTPQSSRSLIRSIRADHSQQISPDGTKIVFASDRTGNYEIWIADADGKNQRQVTDSNGSAGSPRFSPDGKFIAYDAQIANGSHVYIVSIDGGAPRRLTETDKNANLPAWSSDGNWIFFNSNRSGTEQIWKTSTSGGASVQLTKQGAFEMFAAPDGQTIIYSKGAGKAGLWSVRLDGSEEKSIPELSGAGSSRSWSVTSQGVYYLPASLHSPLSLKFYEFATRQTKEIRDIKKSPLAYYSNLAIAPDGKRIFYAQEDQSASTIILAKLLPE